MSVSRKELFCDDGGMKNKSPVLWPNGIPGLSPVRCLAQNSSGGEGPRPNWSDLREADLILPGRRARWMAWFRKHHARLGRRRRGRRRYRGLFFIGKHFFVRGASGQWHDHRLLRTKHRAKILQLTYSR